MSLERGAMEMRMSTTRTRMTRSFRTTRKDRKRAIEKEIYILSGPRPLPGSVISAPRLRLRVSTKLAPGLRQAPLEGEPRAVCLGEGLLTEHAVPRWPP